ncbi:MAG: N-formylglutamate amidohydrolase [Gammaproteobacteria bacterium]|nr:N-formylglutamate amidohydrolase [Gammaproteobacteria bacterium]
MTTQPPLLATADPPAYRLCNPGGRAPWVITADHAGRAIPHALGSLGLSAADLDRHIAWDIGIAGLTEQLAERLDAFAIAQTYSRLVIDCNRAPGTPQSIVTESECTPIPGNAGVSAVEVETRAAAIFHPYHDRIRAELDARAASGRRTLLVALHSFTPVFLGMSRPWHCGVLYQRDARLGHLLLASARREPGLVVGDNQPYAVSDATDYGIPVHGEQRGIAHVELEIRQDLIADVAGQIAWAERIARWLEEALPAL